MANYTKIVDFAVKDTLPISDPLKIITGTAHNNEYVAIQNAIATKLDSVHTQTEKTSIEQADEFTIADYGSAYSAKRITFANLLAARISGLLNSVKLPASTTANRDSSPAVGYLRYNTDLGQFEGYGSSGWGKVGGGTTGGSTDAAFYENDATITTSYTIGQASLISGATVTIATPGVVTLTGHGFIADSQVFFQTTGALPTGLLVDTGYWVIATGLTANAFQLSLTQGGAAINTSGTQSPTHSCGKLKNATSAGTITTATGVTVTIPTNATWFVGL